MDSGAEFQFLQRQEAHPAKTGTGGGKETLAEHQASLAADPNEATEGIETSTYCFSING